MGIGTHERAVEFHELTGFPREYLYADPGNSVYDALELIKSSPVQLFTDKKTPLSIARRFSQGKGGYLLTALRTWKPWIPPKLEQGYQQGGGFVLRGKETLYGRKDPATGDHVDLGMLLQLVLEEK